MKRLILICLLLSGCATLQPIDVAPQIDPAKLEQMTGWFDTALLKDASSSSVWCKGPEGPADINDKVLCALCGDTIIREHDKTMLLKQEALDWIGKEKSSLADGPMIITRLAKLKYGKQVDVKAIERDLFNSYLNIRNACSNIIPEWQIIQLGEFAAGFIK